MNSGKSCSPLWRATPIMFHFMFSDFICSCLTKHMERTSVEDRWGTFSTISYFQPNWVTSSLLLSQRFWLSRLWRGEAIKYANSVYSRILYFMYFCLLTTLMVASSNYKGCDRNSPQTVSDSGYRNCWKINGDPPPYVTTTFDLQVVAWLVDPSKLRVNLASLLLHSPLALDDGPTYYRHTISRVWYTHDKLKHCLMSWLRRISAGPALPTIVTQLAIWIWDLVAVVALFSWTQPLDPGHYRMLSIIDASSAVVDGCFRFISILATCLAIQELTDIYGNSV